MGIKTSQHTLYELTCDMCGQEEKIHADEWATKSSGRKVYVASEYTAIDAADFHDHQGTLFCDDCFKKFQKEKAKKAAENAQLAERALKGGIQ